MGEIVRDVGARRGEELRKGVRKVRIGVIMDYFRHACA